MRADATKSRSCSWADPKRLSTWRIVEAVASEWEGQGGGNKLGNHETTKGRKRERRPDSRHGSSACSSAFLSEFPSFGTSRFPSWPCCEKVQPFIQEPAAARVPCYGVRSGHRAQHGRYRFGFAAERLCFRRFRPCGATCCLARRRSKSGNKFPHSKIIPAVRESRPASPPISPATAATGMVALAASLLLTFLVGQGTEVDDATDDDPTQQVHGEHRVFTQGSQPCRS